MKAFKTLQWIGDCDGFLELIDQRRLPAEFVIIQCKSVEQLYEAIKTLAVRGAPAIGVAAAFGVCLAAQQAGGLNLSDTVSLIEKKAVTRSKKYIDDADLVILVFDGNKKMSAQDKALINKLKNKLTIAVINKADLAIKIERSRILKEFRHTLEISAKKNRNIGLLEDKIAELVFQGKVSVSESVLAANSRQIRALKEAQKFIAQALNSLDNKLKAECIAEDIKAALSCLDEILGKKFSTELLNKIFSEFCIGK